VLSVTVITRCMRHVEVSEEEGKKQHHISVL